MENDKFREDFIDLWEEFMEPLFEDETLLFECSPIIKEHLLKVGRFEYTDNEIWDLVESGKI